MPGSSRKSTWRIFVVMWVCKVSLPRKGREGERWKEKMKKGGIAGDDDDGG